MIYLALPNKTQKHNQNGTNQANRTQIYWRKGTSQAGEWQRRGTMPCDERVITVEELSTGPVSLFARGRQLDRCFVTLSLFNFDSILNAKHPSNGEDDAAGGCGRGDTEQDHCPARAVQCFKRGFMGAGTPKKIIVMCALALFLSAGMSQRSSHFFAGLVSFRLYLSPSPLSPNLFFAARDQGQFGMAHSLSKLELFGCCRHGSHASCPF